jgi:hypothetical protein
VLVAAVVVSTVGLVSCSRGMSRDDVRVGYQRALVRSGVHADQATCLTDKFFATLSDAELREFQKRDHLTADEQTTFGRLAEECGDPSATAP